MWRANVELVVRVVDRLAFGLTAAAPDIAVSVWLPAVAVVAATIGERQIGLLVGLLLSVVGAICGAGPGVVAFETLYVLGSVTAWCATFLLVGPGKQLQLITRSRMMVVVPCYAAAVTVTVVCVAMLAGDAHRRPRRALAVCVGDALRQRDLVRAACTSRARLGCGPRGERAAPMRRDRGARLESANLTRMEEEVSPPEPGGVTRRRSIRC